MNNYLKIINQSFCLLLIVLLTGCSENGLFTSVDPNNITEKRDKFLRSTSATLITVENDYPQSISCISTFKSAKNYYNGSACQLPNGSSFEFQNGALTPPSDHPWGEPVEITFSAEKDPLSNEIIFTFGPSGCTFETPAEVWLNWQDLGWPNATLYYLDHDGNRIEQLPDQIDIYNKSMCIRVKHFSRYAVAYSN